MKRTAAILQALLTMAGQAQALTVSANVGPLLKKAQALAQAEHPCAALRAHLRQINYLTLVGRRAGSKPYRTSGFSTRT